MPIICGSRARGSKSADLGGVLPHFGGVAVHDGLTSYRSYDVPHQLCNAHHLRELQALTETHGKHGVTWPAEMAELLVEVHTAVKTAKQQDETALDADLLAAFQDRYRTLVADGWSAHPPPPPTGKQGRPKLGAAGSLVRRLDLYQDDLLRFATDFAVPFDKDLASHCTSWRGLGENSARPRRRCGRCGRGRGQLHLGDLGRFPEPCGRLGIHPYGELDVSVLVRVPEKLDEEERRLYEQLREHDRRRGMPGSM